MAKKKGIVEKIGEAVDHIIHPEHPQEVASLDEQLTKVVPQESSTEKSDYASHPKFDKFKSSQGAE